MGLYCTCNLSGVLHGIATFVSHLGDKEERCYVNGKLDGPAKYFYTSGSIETRIYEKGVLQVRPKWNKMTDILIACLVEPLTFS